MSSYALDLIYIFELTDSARAPGWMQAECKVDSCDWYTTGSEPVVEDAGWEHIAENHPRRLALA